MFTARKQVIILLLAGLLSVSTAFAAPLNNTLETTDVVVTQSDNYDTSPTLGADAYGEIVVYTSHEKLPDGDRSRKTEQTPFSYINGNPEI